jgi:hypothetical protein
MSKHTPGPWQIVGVNVYGNNLRALLPMNAADAHLISAAPDMLEALETIVSTERDRHGYHPAWTDQARAAIAKARGEK